MGADLEGLDNLISNRIVLVVVLEVPGIFL